MLNFYKKYNTFYVMEVVKMAFSTKPNYIESENITVQFPIEVIDRINDTIAGKDLSFSNFVIQAIEYSLDNIENQIEK
jgi:hypothetical protein